DPASSNGTNTGVSSEATAPAADDRTTPSGVSPPGGARTARAADAHLPRSAAESRDPEPGPAVIPIDDTSVPAPTGWNDPLTGTDGPHYWDRLILSDAPRVRRYHG